MNGFDPSDIPEFLTTSPERSSVLEIVYSGVIDAIRNPLPFLNVLKSVFGKTTGKVRLTFVGRVNESVKQLLSEDSWFRGHVVLAGYVTHKEVFSYYQKAHLLLLILTNTKNAKGNIPGKLFEYMATGRQILALGDPLGDTASIIESSEAGQVYSHTDEAGMAQFIQNFQNSERPKKSDTDIQQYSRKKITAQLALLLDGISKP